MQNLDKANDSIEWLVSGYTRSFEEIKSSHMASIRLRAALCMQIAKENKINFSFSDGANSIPSRIIFVGKIDTITDAKRSDRWLNYLNNAKNLGAKIIIDYTDHHLEINTPTKFFYLSALKIADRIICSSITLKQYLQQNFKHEISIIEDPIEVNIRKPKRKRTNITTALWFGHATNLIYLIDFLKNDYNYNKSLRLIVMSNLKQLPDDYQKQLLIPKLRDLEIHMIPWSIKDMEEAADLSDFCVIPAGLNNPKKNGASSNRLMTALALGLPVAADLLPSYTPYSDYFAKLRTSEFMDLIDNPLKYRSKIKHAQKNILSDFTFQKIGTFWLDEIQFFLKK